MSETIEILYKCKCLDAEVKLLVPARRGPAHDVVGWINDIVGARISADHKKRSPACSSTTTEFVKIPTAPGDGYLGQAAP